MSLQTNVVSAAISPVAGGFLRRMVSICHVHLNILMTLVNDGDYLESFRTF